MPQSVLPAYAAKRVLYADAPAIAPVDWPWTDIADPLRDVADIPAPGTAIAPGDPVMTVFASGSTHAEAMAKLEETIKLWRERIARWGNGFG
jgi:predicted ATP-grasp superfamily ATP-dependent carboligase